MDSSLELSVRLDAAAFTVGSGRPVQRPCHGGFPRAPIGTTPITDSGCEITSAEGYQVLDEKNEHSHRPDPRDGTRTRTMG